jgi:dTDP-4-dehydrorhamnose reductase
METHRPDVVINAAAFTKVDAAEHEPELAHAINAAGARNVATAAERIGAQVIHISTDYVFDGTRSAPYSTDSPPNPVSVYGSSKLAGERAVLETSARSLIVRTGWLYAAHGKNFLRTILAALESERPLTVVNDQTGVPTSARELAETIWLCAGERRITGVQHWVNDGRTTWHGFAVRIQELAAVLGLVRGDAEIAAIPTSGYPTAARRPSFSVLDASGLWRALGKQANPWELALSGVLKEIAKAR